MSAPGSSRKLMSETRHLSKALTTQDNKHLQNAINPQMNTLKNSKRMKRETWEYYGNYSRELNQTCNYFIHLEKLKYDQLQTKLEKAWIAEQVAMREKGIAEENVKKITKEKDDFINQLLAELESIKRKLNETKKNFTDTNERNKNITENLEEQLKRERNLTVQLINQLNGNNNTRKTNKTEFEDEIKNAIAKFDFINLDGMKRDLQNLTAAKSECEHARIWERNLTKELLHGIVQIINKTSRNTATPKNATSSENVIESAMLNVDLGINMLLELNATMANCEKRRMRERNLTGELISTVNNKENRQANMTNFKEEIQIAITKLNDERNNAMILNAAIIKELNGTKKNLTNKKEKDDFRNQLQAEEFESVKRELDETKKNFTNTSERNKNITENLEEQLKRERNLTMQLINQLNGNNNTRKTNKTKFEDEIKNAIAKFDFINLDGIKRDLQNLTAAKSECEHARIWERNLTKELLHGIVQIINKTSRNTATPKNATSSENVIESAMLNVDLGINMLLELNATMANCEKRRMRERNLTGELISTVNNKENRQANMTNFKEEIQNAITKLNDERNNAMILNAAKIQSEKLMIEGQRNEIDRLNEEKKILKGNFVNCENERKKCLTSLKSINASLIRKTKEAENDRSLRIGMSETISFWLGVLKKQKENCSIDIQFARAECYAMILAKNYTDKLNNKLKKQVEDLEKNVRGKTHNSIDLLNAEKNCLQTINQTKNQCELARILESNKTQSIVNRLNDEKKILEENATKCWEDMEKYKRFLDVVNRNHSYELNVTKVKGEKKMIRERNETALFAFELLYDTIKKLDENITNWENKLLECNSNLKIANMNNALFTEKETYYLAQAKNLTACQRQLIKVNDELEKC